MTSAGTKAVLTIWLSLGASLAHADTSITTLSSDDAHGYEIVSTEAAATGADIGPLESRLMKTDASETRSVAGDAAILRVAEGTQGRTSSGSALVTTKCDNGGFTVATFGALRPRICEILAAYPEKPGVYRMVAIRPPGMSLSDFGGIFYQSGPNWVELAFAQSFKAPWGAIVTLAKDEDMYESSDVDGSITFHTPFLGPLMNDETRPRVWPIGYGAAASYRDGVRTVLPPGLSVVTADGLCTRIKPLMDPFGVILLTAKRTPPPTAEEIAASFKEYGCEQKSKPVPVVGLLLLFGIPLLIIGGIAFGIRRFIRHRRGALPGPGLGGLPPIDDSARIPLGMSDAEAAAKASATSPRPASQTAADATAETPPDASKPLS